MTLDNKDDIEAKSPPPEGGEEEKQPETAAADDDGNDDGGEKKEEAKKKREKNPRFKDVEETGKWGEVGKKEIYCVVAIALLVVIAVVVVLVILLGGEDTNNSNSPIAQPTLAPTLPPLTAETKLAAVLAAFESKSHTGTLWDETNMPNDISYYSTIDDSSATANQRAMKWLLSDEYQYSDEGTASFRFAVATLYYSLGGENWKDSTNWLSSNSTCDWYGLKCEIGSTTLVREVTLDGNNCKYLNE